MSVALRRERKSFSHTSVDFVNKGMRAQPVPPRPPDAASNSVFTFRREGERRATHKKVGREGRDPEISSSKLAILLKNRDNLEGMWVRRVPCLAPPWVRHPRNVGDEL